MAEECFSSSAPSSSSSSSYSLFLIEGVFLFFMRGAYILPQSFFLFSCGKDAMLEASCYHFLSSITLEGWWRGPFFFSITILFRDLSFSLFALIYFLTCFIWAEQYFSIPVLPYSLALSACSSYFYFGQSLGTSVGIFYFLVAIGLKGF